MLSGRLRNSLRFIMVLGFLGGFVGSTFKGILSGSEFCPHEIVPVTWKLKYLPPSPSSGVLVYRNKSIFLHWELKSLFVHNVQILQNYFWLFCPQVWLPCQPVYLFISKVCFLRATKTVLTYIVQKTVLFPLPISLHSSLGPCFLWTWSMDPVQNNFLTVAGQQIFAWSSLDRSNKLSINTQLRQKYCLIG